MEEPGVLRGSWDGEAKAVQQCLTDIFTSVYTTCDIPENAIFGPCVLSHTSLYDSIAFVALKSTDKRTVPYIFRVDTSAANGSSEGLMWLRLVQSARDKEEQNLEAYIKNGQLFYRSLRRIAKDEELLVWYGKELTELLLLTSTRSHSKINGSPSCAECGQRFQFEFPLAAHQRFRCPKRLPAVSEGSSPGEEESVPGKEPPEQPSKQPRPPQYPRGGGCSSKPSTDFHNLARELERCSGAGSPSRERPPEESPPSQGKAKRKQGEQPQYRFFPLEERPPSSSTSGSTPEGKRSAFVEVKKGAARGGEQEQQPEGQQQQEGQPQPGLGGRQGGGSAFSAVAPEERKSAFSQPARSSPGAPLGLAQKLGALGEEGGGRLFPQEGAKQEGAAGGAKQSPFLYAAAPTPAPPFWPKGALPAPPAAAPLQLQLPSALTLLPPSFTSLCLPAQNWCAKCNASFRMTSDLVYHMRSHHKKEYALEPLVKRRREEKLRCPICNEAFRERHHLSRHMTSHN